MSNWEAVVSALACLLAVIGIAGTAYCIGVSESQKQALLHPKAFIESAIEAHPKEALDLYRNSSRGIDIQP